jgi:hypothetical protein
MLGRWPEPGGDQQRGELVAVQGDGMRLIVHPRPPGDGGTGPAADFQSRPPRQRCRPPGMGSHHPSSVSTALNPRADSVPMMLDLPVPDIPVSSTRFTAAILLPYQATFARFGRQPVARDHASGTCVAADRKSQVPAL